MQPLQATSQLLRLVVLAIAKSVTEYFYTYIVEVLLDTSRVIEWQYLSEIIIYY